jgi:hypothetical protein
MRFDPTATFGTECHFKIDLETTQQIFLRNLEEKLPDYLWDFSGGKQSKYF